MNRRAAIIELVITLIALPLFLLLIGWIAANGEAIDNVMTTL